MQFRFKIQDYQTEAARAVTDVFEGQPKSDPLAYLRDMGSGMGKKGQRLLQLDSETGYGNAALQLTPDALLRNVRRIRHFVYNSDRLTELDRYAEDDGICCMIINMQAFNTSMREGARNKYARKIFEAQDDFGSRRPIDVIADVRPIIIQDEPQKMGGKATQDGIRRFTPSSRCRTRRPSRATRKATRCTTWSSSWTRSTPTTSAW